MKYLGSERNITQSYSIHKYAEDYSGKHLSEIRINGTGKVIKTVNKYKCYEDSINYRDFLNNQKNWKSGNYYNCKSISGNISNFYYDELGGNQVQIETYYHNKKYVMKILHMSEVLVKVGDIIDDKTVIGYQGNTGLVLSSKSKNDKTYGTHVHLEVKDENGISINPRDFALGNIEYSYQGQSNDIDDTKLQIEILVQAINIRQGPSINTLDIGNVYEGEIYNVIDSVDSEEYIWYKIKTNRGLEGYIASKKGAKWINLSNPDDSIISLIEDNNNDEENIANIGEQLLVIFECEKDDNYYIYLRKGEKLYLQKQSKN